MTYQIRCKYKGRKNYFSKYTKTYGEAEAIKKELIKESFDFINNMTNKDGSMKHGYKEWRKYYEITHIEIKVRKELVIYNPHPEGKKIGDCSRRALTVFLDAEYEDVKEMTTRVARKYGGHYNDTDNLDQLMYDLDVEYKPLPNLTVEDALLVIPHKRAILDQPEHWVAMYDKKIYDTGAMAYDTPVIGYWYMVNDND